MSDGSQSAGVSQIQAPIGPVGHFGQVGAKAGVQIKSQRIRPPPFPIQQHTVGERWGEETGREEGKVPALCCLKEP